MSISGLDIVLDQEDAKDIFATIQPLFRGRRTVKQKRDR